MKQPEFRGAKVFGLISGPALFILIILWSPETALNPLAWKVIASAVWMVVWWVTEAAPIAVTALLPIILFPLTGVFTVDEATAPYANKIIFLFMGGFLLGLAMERHNLHKRIALNLIKLTGTNPNGIILGFMVTTAFISMWISNTATTVMMLPIAISITNLLGINNESGKGQKRFALSLMLGIAYAANIGGTATIIGTPPNVAWVGFMNDMLGVEVTFAKYLTVGLPICLIMLTITYLLITRVLYPSKLDRLSESSQVIEDQLIALGQISKAEKRVAIIFVSTALAWILRGSINNWFDTNLLNDSIIAMAGGILMFITPLNIKKGQYLMEWEYTSKLPWGILLLFGGGLTLAKAMEKSDIVQIVGESIAGNGDINTILLVAGLIAFMLFMTELMSNVALTVIFIPVVIGISISLKINPMYLTMPVTLAASYAFMMPISTPPNAIVFSSGMVRIKDMMRAGILLNVIAILLLVILSQTLIPAIY
ncbi:SLC13 family permease [Roseivirga misakiensis]|uniref:Anion transporter n=1 Tax=Roseivirga misakiensis TaxID=1563681 RepID=A0A1E5T4X3_9BACT|nr:DASS family sodium-coupled anion symporter [Roseivirga misakiensis]OEK06419.1 anion transporter [Roseivirga misakiensis]